MDLHYQAHLAHMDEKRAVRQEARLHNRAVNAAMHGNIGKAIALESRAGEAHMRAVNAQGREIAALEASSVHHHHHYGPRVVHHRPAYTPPAPVYYPPTPASVHVVHHYPSAAPPAPSNPYPMGTVPPPSAAPAHSSVQTAPPPYVPAQPAAPYGGQQPAYAPQASAYPPQPASYPAQPASYPPAPPTASYPPTPSYPGYPPRY